jgi:RNA polymerase sigma factor (sigma-70 family)
MDRARDDLDLVARLVEGDPPAWERFEREHAPGALAAIRAAAGPGDSGLVDDAFAELLKDLVAAGCRALRGFRGEASLGTWLAVLGRRVLGRLRSERAREQSSRRLAAAESARAHASPSAASAASPADAAVRREEAAALELALASLAPRDRLVLALFYEQGLGHREIARLTGIGETSVSQVLARARGRARAVLERKGKAQT